MEKVLLITIIDFTFVTNCVQTSKKKFFLALYKRTHSKKVEKTKDIERQTGS